ncbi:MAG: ATP-binding protein [Pseudomonadota bacterium]
MTEDENKAGGTLENGVLETLGSLGARLEASVRLLSTISRLAAAPVEKKDLRESASKILEIILREMDDIESCSLLFFDPGQNLLTLLAARDQDDLYDRRSGPVNADLAFSPGEGLAGQAFSSREPLFWSSGLSREPLVRKKTFHFDPISLACLPLSLPGEVIGVLNLSFGQARAFDLPRRRDLIILSEVVANTIQAIFFQEQAAEKTAFLARTVAVLENEIEERKRAEKALHKSEERYRDLFNRISDFIFVHDINGTILSANPALAAGAGLPPDRIIGRNIRDLVSYEFQKPFQDQYFEQLKKTGEVDGVFTILDSRNNPRYIEFRSSLGVDEQGRSLVTGSGRDITERVCSKRELNRLEAQLLHSQKMEAVGTLASGIAHDFNNILQAISGNVQILCQRKQPPRKAGKHLVEIDFAVQRARRLVHRLLTFGRKTETRIESLDPKKALEGALMILERTLPRDISLELDIPFDIRAVRGDATQLEQILMNLVVNARDALPGGGRISVALENRRLDEETCRSLPAPAPGDYVLLTVADNGVGIDQETMEHIFEPFFTTKGVGQGAGLGLSVVFGIVQAHRGHIACESRPGEGTTFTVYLPAGEAGEETSARPRKKRRRLKKGGETILLVDDEEAIIEVAGEALENAGYRTLVADCGEKALEMIESKKERVDLVMLDLGMPGMGGVNCLKRLVKIRPGLKVIIASGYSDHRQVQETLSLGAACFINKPYRLADVVSRVREVLDA